MIFQQVLSGKKFQSENQRKKTKKNFNQFDEREKFRTLEFEELNFFSVKFLNTQNRKFLLFNLETNTSS